MEQAENQRVRLSKRLIKESLTQLLQETSVHKISIRALCERAGVNRSTFYKYYGSQYDVLEEMEGDLISSICDTLEDSDSDIEMLEKICTYLERNAEAVRALVGNNVDPGFPQKLFALPQIREMMATRLSGRFDGESQEYIYDFIINGCYTVIRRWLSGARRMPAGRLALLLGRLVDRICTI